MSLPQNQRKGRPNKNSLLAHGDMERLGVNPIEMLVEVYREAMNAYKTGRGYGEKSDAGSQYLAVAGKAAIDLAKFKHPTLSAIAVKDMSQESEKNPMTTAEAIEVIKSDPFAPKEIKEIPSEKILEAMNSQISTPFLPTGKD